MPIVRFNNFDLLLSSGSVKLKVPAGSDAETDVLFISVYIGSAI